ncbi:MAG: hypothetical protein HKN29_13640 [Rhodothermales bacterium]|nr:hypothetical protein [Rhodothermales bacterium]
MATPKQDQRLALAHDLTVQLLRDPAVTAVGGEGIETRGRGPTVRGVAVDLEEGALEVGISLRFQHVANESLPTIVHRVRGECRKTWERHGIEGAPEVDLHIVDLDD